jgi:hypothetical protein
MENPVYGKYCFTAGDQEGVLDGLLEALQSGSAFAKAGGQKKRRKEGIVAVPLHNGSTPA